MFNKLAIALTVATVFSSPLSNEKGKGAFEVKENQVGLLSKREVFVTPEDAPAKKDAAATPPEKKEEGFKFPDFNAVGEQVTKAFSDFTKGNDGKANEKKEPVDQKATEPKKDDKTKKR